MDGLNRRELDRYITDGHFHKESEELVCKSCGHIFEWTVCYEYGMSSYEPEDVQCPKCGAEYDEEEDGEEEDE